LKVPRRWMWWSVLSFRKCRAPGTPSTGGLADVNEEKNLRPLPALNPGPPDTVLIELSSLL